MVKAVPIAYIIEVVVASFFLFVNSAVYPWNCCKKEKGSTVFHFYTAVVGVFPTTLSLALVSVRSIHNPAEPAAAASNWLLYFVFCKRRLRVHEKHTVRQRQHRQCTWMCHEHCTSLNQEANNTNAVMLLTEDGNTFKCASMVCSWLWLSLQCIKCRFYTA